MSTTCYACGHPVNEELRALDDRINWSLAEDTRIGSKVRNYYGSSDDVVVVDKQTTAVESQGDDNQSVWIVVKVDGRFYKKHGTGDSYGEVSWNGFLKEVFPKEKTVVAYEYE